VLGERLAGRGGSADTPGAVAVHVVALRQDTPASWTEVAPLGVAGVVVIQPPAGVQVEATGGVAFSARSPTAVQEAAVGQETPESMTSPVKAWMLQRVPFQRSARGGFHGPGLN
jgi:hypothetical protein